VLKSLQVADNSLGESEWVLEVNGEPVKCTFADWGGAQDLEDMELVMVAPMFADSALTNAGQLSGNIAVVYRGKVGFHKKVKRLIDAGACGVVVVNDDARGADSLITMAEAKAIPGGIEIPIMLVSFNSGEYIAGELGQASCGFRSGARHFSQALLYNSGLSVLDVSRNCIPQGQARELKQACAGSAVRLVL
jgi:hypothetical protein